MSNRWTCGERLTDDEAKVVEYAERGWSDIQIGMAMGYSDRTVQRRKRSAYMKIHR